MSVVFLIITGYYIIEVIDARFSFLFSDNEYYSNSTINRSGSLTTEVGLLSLLFFSFFLTVFLFSLLRIKTRTSKIFSIIGLSLTGIFLIWNIAMLISPSSMSFDEVGGGWIFYGVIMLTSTIVGLVQSVRQVNGGSLKKRTVTNDLLDR